MQRYKDPYDRYNRFHVVKVNLPIAASVLFLSRHILTFLFLGIAFSRTHIAINDAFGGLFEPVYMLSDIPALVVFLAMLARHPNSGRPARIAWRLGPYLLLGSAVGYLALLGRQIGFGPGNFGWAAWVMVLGTAAAIAYIFLSPYARDVFREFPDAALRDDAKRK